MNTPCPMNQSGFTPIQSGFTLMEVLVSVGVLAVVGTLITQSLVTTIRSNTKTELLKDIKQNGDFAIGTMVRMVQNASMITSCNTSPGAPDIVITNADGNATRFHCVDVGNGVRRIASESSLRTEYLTSPSHTVNAASCGLVFRCSSLGGVYNSVRITFTLEQVSSSAETFEKASETFQTLVNIRNVAL